jgi:hypothetical protein
MQVNGNLDLLGGELQNAKQETYASVPSFVVGTDEGRIIYVSSGGDRGYWLGAEDGSASWKKLPTSTSFTEYTTGLQAIADAASYQATLSGASGGVKYGTFTKVEITSSLGSGKVLVEVFNDLGRLDRVYANYFDLAATATLKDNLMASFEVDNDDGDIYISVTNQTGSLGNFTVDVQAAGLILVQTPPPPGDGTGINSGVAGNGIVYDVVNARLDIDLNANSGLQLTGVAGAQKISVLPAPGGGLSTGATGTSVDATVVKSTGDVSIAGKKVFSDGTIALTPQGAPGPPAAGTWSRGAFYTDSEDDVWYCLTGGTPGTWRFWGWRQTTVGGLATSYTGAVAAGATTDVTISTLKGRRGVVRKMWVWGSDSVRAADNQDVPYRVSCHSNENFYGKDMIWMVTGQLRKTYLTPGGGMASGTAVATVSTVNIAEPDDLLRFRKAVGPAEEYGRITVRTPGGPSFTVDENVTNAFAQNDLVMVATEFLELPWWNDSAVAGNYQKMYLRFHNDDDTATVVFGYELFVEQIGGGQSF